MSSTSSRSVDEFKTLFQYNRWASDRILETMQTADNEPERALDLFSHLLLAQDMWFGRVQGTDHATLDLWETEPLSACAVRLEASTRRWRTVLEKRGDDLDRVIGYTNSSGEAFETPLRDIFSHVINHGTHHRAQIALVLRGADIAPPATDYIFYVREG